MPHAYLSRLSIKAIYNLNYPLYLYLRMSVLVRSKFSRLEAYFPKTGRLPTPLFGIRIAFILLRISRISSGGKEMMVMSDERKCQVCRKPISERDVCLKKNFRGRAYDTCCPICFSILQRHPEKFILAAVPAACSQAENI